MSGFFRCASKGYDYKKLILLSISALCVFLLVSSLELASAEITVKNNWSSNCQKSPIEPLDQRYTSDFGVTTAISVPAFYVSDKWVVACASEQACGLYTSPNRKFYIDDPAYKVVGKRIATGWLTYGQYQVYIFYFALQNEFVAYEPPCEWVCDLDQILYDTNGQCQVALLSTQPGYARAENRYYSWGLCPNDAVGHNYPSCKEFGPLPSPPDARMCAGDPVDAFSGVYFYNEEDIGYPYPSMVSIVRKYSSGISAIGPFGVGTSIDYNHRLVEIEGFYFYAPPDGGLYILKQDTGGSYSNADYPFLRHVKFYVSPEKRAVFKGGDVFDFYQNGYLRRITDANGNWAEITRDGSGSILGITDSFGRSLEITNTAIDVNGTSYTVIGSVKDALQMEVRYMYDELGQLVSVVMPDFSEVDYSYENGMVKSVYKKEDNRLVSKAVVPTPALENFYDPVTRGVSLQRHSNGLEHDFYFGKYTGWYGETVYNYAGISTNEDIDTKSFYNYHEFNNSGYVSKVVEGNMYRDGSSTISDPETLDTRYYRDSSNAVTEIEENGGYFEQEKRTVQFGRDANGLINAVTDGAGNVTLVFYDNADLDKPTRVVDALGNTASISYDASGNPASVLAPGASQPAIFSYNEQGLIAGIANPAGESTRFEYYSHGMIANILDPLGNSSHFEYDGIGRITSYTDPRGKATAFVYSADGRTVETTDPELGNTVIAYNSLGLPVTAMDARGNTTRFTYNDRGDLLLMTDPVSKVASVTYYNRYQPYMLTDRMGRQVQYYYGSLDRSVVARYLSDFTYDSYENDFFGRFTGDYDSRLGGTGDHVAFDYTEAYKDCLACGNVPDRVKMASSLNGNISYGYDVLGRRTSMLPDGQPMVSYTYYPDGLLNGVGVDDPAHGALNFGFTYDGAGRRKGVTYPNGVTTSYDYDAAGRIVGIEHKNPSGESLELLRYSYDASGNIKASGRLDMPDKLGGLTNSPDFDPANRMETFNGEALAYDLNGNLTRKGNAVYIWDSRDRLVGIANSPAGDASFVYDPLGRRIEKTVNGATTKYLYDGLDVIQEKDASGNIEAYYIRTLDMDEPLARVSSDGNIRYYHTDALGSVIALTDENGAVKTRYNYGPYGEAEVIGEPSDNPFQFTGKENDGTGLAHFPYRYYSYEMGRFISEDPIGFAGGDVNLYAYTGNNPVNFVDPEGLVVDTIADIGFILYDIYRLGRDNIFGDTDNFGENIASLGADVGGAFLPGATGLGLCVREGKAGGRLGGTLHRAKVAERGRHLEHAGYDIRTGGGGAEKMVKTPGGEKKYRFPDISAIGPNREIYYENIGRTTKDGKPIARERRALEDIQKATGKKPGYTGY